MLDEQLQPDLELMPDDDARAMCMEIIDNKNVADIRDYPVKSYLTRVQENGRSYDVAVVARQDRRGVVLAYVEKNDITDEGSELTLENLFTGFQFDMKGVAVVLGEDRVAATNAPALVGLTLSLIHIYLASRFIKNFAKYEGNEAGKKLVAAGPKL